MSDNLTLFIAITAAAVVLQMIILLAMCVVMFRLSKKLQSVTDETQSRLFPILDNAKVMQQEIKSFLELLVPRSTSFSTTLRMSRRPRGPRLSGLTPRCMTCWIVCDYRSSAWMKW